MLGIILLIIGVIMIGVGTQAKRESAIEAKQGLPAAKFTGAPFYVIGALLALAGLAMVVGVIHVGDVLQ